MEGAIVSLGQEAGVISPTTYDYVDVAFRWRVANRGSYRILLGGRLVLTNGSRVYRVNPGNRYSMRPDEPRYMLQYVGFLTEMPPGGISEVVAWIQIGVENLKGTGPYDITVAICDASQATGEAARTVLEYTESNIFSVGVS